MSDILSELAAGAVERTAEAKQKIPLEEMKEMAFAKGCDTGFPFHKALVKEGMSFICECKKASPSKGLIAADFPYVKIAQEYEEAGASAVSVLTEPTRFLGSVDYLKEISEAVKIPVLRKDFIVDPYMIYEAKAYGAAAVLLIVSLLSEDQLREYIAIAHGLGLDTLVEAHDENEVPTAVKAGADIIGVNNRNLRDFTVDFGNSLRLRSLVPKNILFVAESGVHTREDIVKLEEGHMDAVLIGEQLMRSENKKQMLAELKGIQEA